MTPLLVFATVFPTATIALFPVFLLREKLRPRSQPYDWPVWVWRAALAIWAYLGVHEHGHGHGHHSRDRQRRA